MQEKKFTRAKKVIEALRNHYGEKVGEFANRLGVAASTVSTWANRDTLDEDLIFRKCEGVRFEFLQTGEGEMFEPPVAKEPPMGYAVSGIHRKLSPDEERLLEIMGTVPEAREAMETFLQLPERKRKIHLGKMLEDLEKLEEEK